MITKPGIYTDIPTEAYFADCCPSPSLTQSIAKLLLERSPAHAWHAHPKLNPHYSPDEDTKFDVANAAHLLTLGRGKEVVAVEAPDWRTKAARETRDALAADGKVGVLAKHYERARHMSNAAKLQLSNMGLNIPGTGASEVVLAWREGDLWMRAMIDHLSGDGLIVFDLKTTKESAAPQTIGRKMANDGWMIQAAMHERGLNVLAPQDAGRRRHIFACQECEEPYAMTVCEISESAMTIGRKMLQSAVDMWGRCMRVYGTNGTWPAYGKAIVTPELPQWFESQWLEREIQENENSSLLMAG